jgi:hydroxyacylglutathione hydrolase
MLVLEETQFVDGLTSSLPARPPNIERIVELNRRVEGPIPAEPRALRDPLLRELLAQDATVLDCRSPALFDGGHLAGAINLPVTSPGVGTRAGWALDPAQPIVIVADEAPAALEMVSALQAVGFWRLEGYDLADRERWEHAGLPVARSTCWDVDELAAGLREHSVQLVDVRELSEWEAGHIEGSHHVPLHRLRDVEAIHIPERGVPTAVACAAGVRAAFAASLLRRAGRGDVVRVAGGIGDLGTRGLELTLGA